MVGRALEAPVQGVSFIPPTEGVARARKEHIRTPPSGRHSNGARGCLHGVPLEVLHVCQGEARIDDGAGLWKHPCRDSHSHISQR